MTSYQVHQAPRTFSSNLFVLSSLLAAGQAVAIPTVDRDTMLVDRIYHTQSASASFDQYRILLGSSLEQGQDKFVGSVSDFYAGLLAKQESLGEEFSQILHENLWDLYER